MMQRPPLRSWPIIAGVLLAAGLAIGAPAIGSVVTVRVLTAKVMKTPKFIGPAAGDASRGEQLKVEEVKGDWYRVSGALSGWIHKTNLTERQVALSSKPGGDGAGTASRDEVELAGRGFTPQVEQAYRASNPNLDFSHVDAIEKVVIDPGELEAFIKEGKLAGGDQ
jgi:hypothetical protein